MDAEDFVGEELSEVSDILKQLRKAQRLINEALLLLGPMNAGLQSKRIQQATDELTKLHAELAGLEGLAQRVSTDLGEVAIASAVEVDRLKGLDHDPELTDAQVPTSVDRLLERIDEYVRSSEDVVDSRSGEPDDLTEFEDLASVPLSKYLRIHERLDAILYQGFRLDGAASLDAPSLAERIWEVAQD